MTVVTMVSDLTGQVLWGQLPLLSYLSTGAGELDAAYLFVLLAYRIAVTYRYINSDQSYLAWIIQGLCW
ncbi:hypothetical protein BJX61DRAFT_509317 [Aspergillus egyptiacus]|nr:hypothetical protein BJX61DRAFT_509317 [Aspergillus egyptiacus]